MHSTCSHTEPFHFPPGACSAGRRETLYHAKYDLLLQFTQSGSSHYNIILVGVNAAVPPFQKARSHQGVLTPTCAVVTAKTGVKIFLTVIFAA